MEKEMKKDESNKVQASSVMSIKEWLIVIIIASIPLIGIIMLFIWAFSDDTNVNKANWAKANLIFYAIIFGLGLLGMVFMISIFASLTS